MTGQTTPAEQVSATGLSRHEAFVCLLLASARSDGSVSPHEANQIEHVAAAMKLFRGSSYETRHGIFTTVAERIKEQGIDEVVRAAAPGIPCELRATAFAVAVDLMLSDGRLTVNEQRFADQLRGLLNVDREMAAKIVDVLTIKNAAWSDRWRSQWIPGTHSRSCSTATGSRARRANCWSARKAACVPSAFASIGPS
jgi:hypothetical protein